MTDDKTRPIKNPTASNMTEILYGDSYGERFRMYEDTIAELKRQNESEEQMYLDIAKEKAELKAQIEKMKNCWNCKYGFCGWSSESIIDGKRQCHAWNKEKEEYCDIGYQGKYQCWEFRR